MLHSLLLKAVAHLLCCAMLCCAVQVPHLDGAKATQTNRALRGPRANAKLAMAALADLASETAGNPVYVPLVS